MEDVYCARWAEVNIFRGSVNISWPLFINNDANNNFSMHQIYEIVSLVVYENFNWLRLNGEYFNFANGKSTRENKKVSSFLFIKLPLSAYAVTSSG